MSNSRRKGYNWEVKVKKLLEDKDFNVLRVGNTTTEYPDLVARNAECKLIISVECKSVSGNRAFVPVQQLMRCIDEVNKDRLYEFKIVILAFQFGRYTKNHEKGNRERKEYLKIWNFQYKVSDVSCNYDGVCKVNGDVVQLEDWK